MKAIVRQKREKKRKRNNDFCRHSKIFCLSKKQKTNSFLEK